MKVALVGLPRSGKTSLFTALTGAEPHREKAGKYRLEGRDYVVRDGDIVHFRSNV